MAIEWTLTCSSATDVLALHAQLPNGCRVMRGRDIGVLWHATIRASGVHVACRVCDDESAAMYVALTGFAPQAVVEIRVVAAMWEMAFDCALQYLDYLGRVRGAHTWYIENFESPIAFVANRIATVVDWDLDERWSAAMREAWVDRFGPV